SALLSEHSARSSVLKVAGGRGALPSASSASTRSAEGDRTSLAFPSENAASRCALQFALRTISALHASATPARVCASTSVRRVLLYTASVKPERRRRAARGNASRWRRVRAQGRESAPACASSGPPTRADGREWIHSTPAGSASARRRP